MASTNPRTAARQMVNARIKATTGATPPKPANTTAAKAPAKITVAEKWSTVTVTVATPAYTPNRATPMDIAYDAARINGVAILKLDGKADKTYVRCAEGTVRSAKSPLAIEALAAHATAQA